MEDEIQVIRFQEVEKMWHRFAKQAQTTEFKFELEVYKKLLNIFHVGEYYYYIFNLATAQIEIVSDSVKSVLCFDSTEEYNLNYILSNVHPDDLPFLIEFERTAGEFLSQKAPETIGKYKVTYDFRIKRKDGQYIRLHHQVLPIQVDDNGGIVRTLCTHTNISHIKKGTDMSLSIIGLEGEPSYLNMASNETKKSLPENIFTKQEKAILKLLAEGNNSQEIGDKLHISKFTVDTHRRNMLQKTNARSIAELTLKYLQGNLV